VGQDLVEITSGLAAGDLVAWNPTGRGADGQPATGK
jgi:hypothetical protein